MARPDHWILPIFAAIDLAHPSVLEFTKRLAASTFFRNYIKIFSVDLLVKGSGILLLPIYLKLMSQDEFGLYGYLVAIVSTFSLVFNLGMYTAQSKLYHDYQGEARARLLGTLNIILFTFIFLLFVIIIVFDADYFLIGLLFKNPIHYEKYRPAVLIGVLVSVYSLMLVNFFLTSEDIKKVQWFNVLRIVVINVSVLTIMVLMSDQDAALIRLQYANFTEFALICIFAIFYIRKMNFKFDWKIANQALLIGFPIVVSAVLGIFINLSDRYFVEKFGSLKDLSIYNVALSIAGLVPFIFASFQNLWLPQFLKEKDVAVNRQRSKKMVFRLLIGFVILSVGIVIALKVLLLINVIDNKYDELLPLLPIVLMTSIVTSLTHMFSNYLIYFGKLHFVIFIGVPIAIAGILLNMQLVPRFNIYGAAVSALVMNSLFLASYIILAEYYNKKHAAKPIAE